jgi:hypothetical protein
MSGFTGMKVGRGAYRGGGVGLPLLILLLLRAFSDTLWKFDEKLPTNAKIRYSLLQHVTCILLCLGFYHTLKCGGQDLRR